LFAKPKTTAMRPSNCNMLPPEFAFSSPRRLPYAE
jgi:hypothetical protein